MRTAPDAPTIERLNDGEPIIAPTDLPWEDGVTFNSAALLLEGSERERLGPILLGDADAGDDPLVVVHYRARPMRDEGYALNRSYVGLAVFTPAFELLRRYDTPIVSPEEDALGFDALGVEDPRITRIGDAYYMVYCGVAPRAEGGWTAQVCIARSSDLLAWEKLGPSDAAVNFVNNKDGVLFPDLHEGRYVLLHRPMSGAPAEYKIELAVADTAAGPWTNYGGVLGSIDCPECEESWVGAGSVPIALGNGRYLVIFHTGNRLPDGERAYQLDVAIFDMGRLDASNPTAIVTHRLDRIMLPETPREIDAPYADSVGNVVFACGSYEHGDHIYIVYGGGDTYILAARVDRHALIAAVERHPV
jgi:beta-1,2-mannobiose phosphorylase / 1,2-beta-oligomannan phosphorylase